ncbi:MAG: DNA adenine methylase [Bacteroidales bacterium]|nr:DNA adenine methylase [Bacteroidales bacterium]
MPLPPLAPKRPQPFVKWAGGKTRLLPILEEHLPCFISEGEDATYIEPFVGGGALAFRILEKYQGVKAVLNDINPALIHSYRMIKEHPDELKKMLKAIEETYMALPNHERQKEYYYRMREEYNRETSDLNVKAAKLIFLNRTCFNGLYRENEEGKFNVPFGRYKHPNIYDEVLIDIDHIALQRAEILTGHYKNAVYGHTEQRTFVYLDPPYRPISKTSRFHGYHGSGFHDKEQKDLKLFCDYMSDRGVYWMLSNSYSLDDNGESYFHQLFKGYRIEEISAPRSINAHATTRKPEKEVLIMNYTEDNKILRHDTKKNIVAPSQQS